MEGWKLTAVDVSSVALKCARKNAEANNVTLRLKQSDLFGNVKGKFDLIVFNPPYGHSSKFVKPMEFLKSFLPRNNRVFSAISYALIKKQRRRLIRRFLTQYRKRLNKNGSIIIALHESETSLTESWKSKMLEKVQEIIIVSLE